MLQDPNVERYIANAVKPLKKEIEQMKAQIEALNQALRIHGVVGQSEQFICRDCEKTSKEYRDQLCEPCHKWHTDS